MKGAGGCDRAGVNQAPVSVVAHEVAGANDPEPVPDIVISDGRPVSACLIDLELARSPQV